ncbi:hypothetical protein Poly30_25670 [Planctomycetes bacterium Poly30]|uniref:ATP-grasp domain-containing protein n=1 Tax=Saltatorellus ferox TaxID=2528018 RepID=A0A518ESH7_9BACT|nr:hypothetical protein Poly30_25670 [Planctomycetes bacterium Poly30]
MSVSRVWVLNFDAEAELATGRRAPVPFLGRPSWIAHGDLVLDGAGPGPGEGVLPASGRDGVAWCPTPDALRLLRAAGARRLPRAPAEPTLRAANARETFADLHPLAAFGASVAETSGEVEAALRRPALPRHSSRAPAWWLRESLCAAGQGRFLAERWTRESAAWTERAFESGPVHVLPVVDIEEEFSAHAFLFSSGATAFGRHVGQVVRGGSWRSAEPLADSIPELETVLGEVEARLRAMDYAGPVGVDGFRWRDADGASHIAAGTDINARYTMSMGAAFDEVPTEWDAPRGPSQLTP